MTESAFWSKVDKTDSCWVWTACLTNGYGQLVFNGRRIHAHRLSLLLSGIEIPEGLTVDHLCRNRACVNPEHLECVSIRENVLRGIGLPAVNAKKTHCKYGHLLPSEYAVKSDGQRERVCQPCMRRYRKDWRQRNPNWVRRSRR